MADFVQFILKAFVLLSLVCSTAFFFILTLHYTERQKKFIEERLQKIVKDVNPNITLPQISEFKSYIVPVSYVTLITIITFITLFASNFLVDNKLNSILLFSGLDFVGSENKNLETTIAITGFTLLGSFIGSAQYILKSFLNTNLAPLQFIQVGIKSTLALLVAMVINLIFGNLNNVGWLFISLCFLIGLFPFVQLKYIVGEIGLFFKKKDKIHDNIEFSYIEGINTKHKIKLKEIGIENVQNLAQCNLLMLIIKTPFPVRTLIDWIAQARLIITFREEYIKLRNAGIRTILDLESFSSNAELTKLEKIAEEFDLNFSVIKHVCVNLKDDNSVTFLSDFSKKLGDADLMR